jgi:peroxiredoxin
MSLSRRKEKRKKKRSPVEILGFLAIAAFVGGLLWLALSTPPNSGQTTSQTTSIAHSPAPDFLLTDVNGTTFRLSDYRGRVVVLEFMQTTCGYCKEQEPRMRELRSRFPGDVVMVMISTNPGDTEEILRQYRDQNLVGWIAIRDTSGVINAYNVQGTPTIFIIDKNGNIAYQHTGFTDSDSAPALISEVSSLV